MRFPLFIISSIVLVALFTGCGSTSESDREWMDVLPMDTTATSDRTFETRTDTVVAEGEDPADESKPKPAEERGAQYTVQIGAFKNAKLAGTTQALARQRYLLPVVNDYHMQRHRYQVRIGFFDTHEAAKEFCAQMKKEFPAEYKNAWVAQLNK